MKKWLTDYLYPQSNLDNYFTPRILAMTLEQAEDIAEPLGLRVLGELVEEIEMSEEEAWRLSMLN